MAFRSTRGAGYSGSHLDPNAGPVVSSGICLLAQSNIILQQTDQLAHGNRGRKKPPLYIGNKYVDEL